MLQPATIKKYQQNMKDVSQYMTKHEVSAREACKELGLSFTNYYSQKCLLKKNGILEDTTAKAKRTTPEAVARTYPNIKKHGPIRHLRTPKPPKPLTDKIVQATVNKDKVIFFLGKAEDLVAIIKELH